MIESYFEYCIKRCDDYDIASVCDIYKTKTDIIQAAKQGFNGEKILGQVHLISGADSFLLDNGFVCRERMGRDIKKLYNRFTSKIEKMKETNGKCMDVGREYMFNALIELNWLIPSLYKPIVEGNQSCVELLESQDECKFWLQKAISEEIYDGAIRSKEYSEHFKEAQSFKYSIFTGLIPYPEVNDYISAVGDDYRGLKQQEEYNRTESINYMALFFGLTATAALAEKIRRMDS